MPQLNQGQGFTKRPYAIRKVVVGPDGTSQVVFVDPANGQQVKNPEGYHIIDNTGGNYKDFGKNFNHNGNDNGNKPGADPNSPSVRDPAGRDSFTNAVLGNKGERPQNNVEAAKNNQPKQELGYINKPGWAGFAGFIPGPVGLAATAGNIGVNANNTRMVNDQRETLGFSDKPVLNNIGSALMDKHGYIGEASYKDGMGEENVTPVSFESQDNMGRTTLTPDEARMRNELNPTFQEASLAAKQNAQEEYKNEFGSPGFLSGITNAAKGLFSNMFGTSTSPSGVPSAVGGAGGTTASSSGGSNKSQTSGTSNPEHAPTPDVSPPGHNTQGWSDSH